MEDSGDRVRKRKDVKTVGSVPQHIGTHELIWCHRTLHTVVPFYRLGNEGQVGGVAWWRWFTQLVVGVRPGWATCSPDGIVPHLLLPSQVPGARKRPSSAEGNRQEISSSEEVGTHQYRRGY